MSNQPPRLVDLVARLASHQRSRVVAEGLMKQAAVAAVLRERQASIEVLFIRRAEHPRDPWSGHMAFPGGRVDPDDRDALAAAIRETREEVGLDLMAHARQVGELSHVLAMAHGLPLPMTILPFVFTLEGIDDPALSLSDEVEETIWVPLAFLLDPANRDSLDWTRAGVTLKMPCYRYEGRVIWGLTLRMLDELMELARA